MRAANPRADVALTSGGSLRAVLPVGRLTYGQLHEALPFDDRFVTLSVTGEALAATVARNLGRPGGIVALSGVRARAACAGPTLQVTLTRNDGRPIGPAERLTLVTSEFLATGGGGILSADVRAHATPAGGATIRDVMADLLRGRTTPLDPDNPRLLDPAAPRLAYPGRRPVRCNK
jgi:5'-nucleotidase